MPHNRSVCRMESLRRLRCGQSVRDDGFGHPLARHAKGVTKRIQYYRTCTNTAHACNVARTDIGQNAQQHAQSRTRVHITHMCRNLSVHFGIEESRICLLNMRHNRVIRKCRWLLGLLTFANSRACFEIQYSAYPQGAEWCHSATAKRITQNANGPAILLKMLGYR